MSEHLSNTQLKNRLLGAGMLVLAAVILLPLFLGDPKYVEAPEPEPLKSTKFESRIQPLPGNVQGSQSNVESSAKAAPESGGLVLKKLDNQQAPAAEKTKQIDIQPLRLDKLGSEPTPQAKTVTKVADTPAPKSKPEPVVKKSAPVKTSSTAVKPAVQTVTSGWAVQTNIFSSSENAKNFSVTLKNNGYKPNISDAKVASGKAWRVWVGPFASKSEARAISKRLEQQMGIEGYVRAYPFQS
ncbi:MAG: hypothetical protein GY726_08465 [Proteobacteria bacterium]|nr:hypothetical protein [Pseudomonadota bacterium]